LHDSPYGETACVNMNCPFLKHALRYLDDRNKLDRRLPLDAKKAARYYEIRDRLLFAGFAALFLAKILQPYETDYAPQQDARDRIMNVSSQALQAQGSQDNKPAQAIGTPIHQVAPPALPVPNRATKPTSPSLASPLISPSAKPPPSTN
jgi:hypothetical protein